MFFKIILTIIIFLLNSLVPLLSKSDTRELIMVLEKPSDHLSAVRIDNARDFKAGAESVVLFDPQNRSFIYENNSLEKRRIASITKLMTALTFLDCQVDLNSYQRAKTNCCIFID